MSNTSVTDKPVCVTGASGFIASRLVADLLEAGYSVRGTVRDASAKGKYTFLTSLAHASERLTLVSANLLEPTTFDEAVRGCEYVMHTASPYSLTIKDPENELVKPAVMGTLGVLEACQRAPDIKRVVLTSSVAAISDEPDASTVLTEEDWNEKSSLVRNPYYYSKVKAEKAAWAFMDENKPGFDLVVINPFMVVGPSLVDSLNTSNQVISDLMTGKYPGIVNLAWGLVDVRDVSRAHLLAMENPDASGRFLCANCTLSMRDMVALLKELGFGDYKLPKTSLDNGFGNVLVRFGSLFQPAGVRSYLKTNLGRTPTFDNAKIQQSLGLKFHGLEDTLRDTVADLARWGHIPAQS